MTQDTQTPQQPQWGHHHSSGCRRNPELGWACWWSEEEKEIERLEGALREAETQRDDARRMCVAHDHQASLQLTEDMLEVEHLRLEHQERQAIWADDLTNLTTKLREAEGRAKVAEMMLAQVEGRFMVEGSSVSAETAQGFFLHLLDNDAILGEVRDQLREAEDAANFNSLRNLDLLMELEEAKGERDSAIDALTTTQADWTDERQQFADEISAYQIKLREAEAKAALADEFLMRWKAGPGDYEQDVALFEFVRALQQPKAGA